MDAIQMLQRDLDQEVASVRSIVDAADAEGRPISETERKSTSESLEKITEFKSRIADEKDKAAVRAAVDGFTQIHTASQISDPNPVREPATMDRRARTLGDALISSESFKAWSIATKAAGRAVEFTTPTVEIPYKAAGDPILETNTPELFGSGGVAGPMATMFGLETPSFNQRRLMIADMLPSVPITVGNAATYPVVKTRTALSATPQVEGQAKPGAEYDFDLVTKVLVTLAGWVKVSEQFLEDAPGLAAYINADLPYQVRYNEENYLASALYTAAGAATAISGGTAEFDSILDAKATIQLANFEPNAVLVHPSDWAVLLAEKFGNDNAYVGGGPFTPTNNPWGLNVIVTQAAHAGNPLVGDFTRGAKVYRRGGMSVASTNSDGTDFQKNLITVRAELRCVVGVTYPLAFAEASVAS